MKHFYFLLLSGLLWAPYVRAAEEPINYYDEIRKLVQYTPEKKNTVSLSQTIGKAPEKNGKDYTFGRYEVDQRTLELQTLRIMAQHDENATNGGNVLFTPDTWETLALFQGKNNVLNSIDRTHTLFGKYYLAKMLVTPTTDTELIAKRQSIVTALRTRPELTKKLRKLLTRLGNEQKHLIGLTDEAHPVYDEGLKPIFHKRPMRQLASWIGSGFKGSAYTSPYVGRKSDITWKIADDLWKTVGPALFLLKGIKPLYDNIRGGTVQEFFPERFMDDSIPFDSLKPRTHAIVGWIDDKAPSIRRNLKQCAPYIASATALWLLYQIYLIGDNMVRERPRVLNYFRSQLMQLKVLFKSMKSCSKLAAQLPELEALRGEIDFGTTTNSKDLRDLHSIIHGPAFRESSKPKLDWVLKHLVGGDILQAIPLLHRTRDDLFKGCALIGALDAYLSLATLLNETEHTEHRFTPARFLKQDTPYLSAHNCWHPSIPTATSNSITFGGTHPQNAIVTGLFESGKSTLLQAITLNIIMAQTLGICGSHDTALTPFHSATVYANIKDDIAGDRSLFKMELYRAVQLLEYISKLPEGAFCFTAADSTFTGTEAGAGQAAAYAVARYLGTLPNSIAIHATNFLSMSELGAQQPDAFATYYLPTVFDGNQAAHPFTLLPGSEKAHQSIAIFHEEHFPAEMIATMEKVLKRPQDYPTAAKGMRT